MDNFEERSGVVPCKTPWGSWAQTIDEVVIEVDVPNGTQSREIKCDIRPNSILLVVNRETLLKGKLFGTVVADECVWTLEDKKLLRVLLVKSKRSAANCWRSLLEGQYESNPLVFDEMEKKLTLERFQREHPGFDFSGAEMTGNYSGGGPDL